MRPNPESSAAIQVRLTNTELESLENWRRAQEKIPPRSEALREAIRRLVTAPLAARKAGRSTLIEVEEHAGWVKSFANARDQ